MIQELSAVEHIRLRPGMYVGSTTQDGLLTLLRGMCQELISNSNQDTAQIFLRVSNNKMVLEFSGFSNVEFLRNYAGRNLRLPNNYWQKAFFIFVSVALSSQFIVTVQNGSFRSVQVLSRGHQLSYKSTVSEYPRSFIRFDFQLDPTKWNIEEINFNPIRNCFEQFSILNPKFPIKIVDKDNVLNLYHPKGIKEISEKWKKDMIYELEFTCHQPIGEYYLELESFLSTDCTPTRNIQTFANYTATKLHGSLLNGVFDGIRTAINQGMEHHRLFHSINEDKLALRLNLIAHVHGPKMNYLGATREELGVPEIEEMVRSLTFMEYYNQIKQMDNQEFKWIVDLLK